MTDESTTGAGSANLAARLPGMLRDVDALDSLSKRGTAIALADTLRVIRYVHELAAALSSPAAPAEEPILRDMEYAWNGVAGRPLEILETVAHAVGRDTAKTALCALANWLNVNAGSRESSLGKATAEERGLRDGLRALAQRYSAAAKYGPGYDPAERAMLCGVARDIEALLAAEVTAQKKCSTCNGCGSVNGYGAVASRAACPDCVLGAQGDAEPRIPETQP